MSWGSFALGFGLGILFMALAYEILLRLKGY